MWDWDFEDWVKFSEQRKKELQEWRDLGKTKEQLQKEKEDRERREYEKKHPTPPPTYHDPAWLILYILVMVGGCIFEDRWLIWIAATVIYVNYLRK